MKIVWSEEDRRWLVYDGKRLRASKLTLLEAEQWVIAHGKDKP